MGLAFTSSQGRGESLGFWQRLRQRHAYAVWLVPIAPPLDMNGRPGNNWGYKVLWSLRSRSTVQKQIVRATLEHTEPSYWPNPI